MAKTESCPVCSKSNPLGIATCQWCHAPMQGDRIAGRFDAGSGTDIPAASSPWIRRCSACGADSTADAEFCLKCGSALGEPDVGDLVRMIDTLRAEVAALKATGGATDLPQTRILSEDFMTRAFAVYGHALVAGLIISIPIYVIALLLGVCT